MGSISDTDEADIFPATQTPPRHTLYAMSDDNEDNNEALFPATQTPPRHTLYAMSDDDQVDNEALFPATQTPPRYSTPAATTATTPSASTSRHTPMINLSDSDSDSDLENDHTQAYLAGLNVPDRLKNILSYKDLNKGKQGADAGKDSDSDDSDDELFRRPKAFKEMSLFLNSPTTLTANSARLPQLEKEKSPELTQRRRLAQLLAENSDSDSDSDGGKTNNNKKGKSKKKATTQKPSEKKAPATPKAPKKTAQSKTKTPRKKKETAKAKEDEAGKKQKKKKRHDLDSSDDDDGNNGEEDRLVRNDMERPDLDIQSDSDEPLAINGRRQRKQQLNWQETPALLDDTDVSSDENEVKKRKPLSRKARLEMEQETQRQRRAAQVKIQPRTKPRSLGTLLENLQIMEESEKSQDENKMSPAQPPPMLEVNSMDPFNQSESPARKNNLYEKYQRDLEKLERMNSQFDVTTMGSDDDEDDFNRTRYDDEDGLIICKPDKRKTDFLKSVLAIMSPETNNSNNNNIININNLYDVQPKKSKYSRSPIPLRTLNQQLLAKIGQDQEKHRQQMIDKAKALGVYVTPEERAQQHLEREKEAAVLDLEVQQLLQRKAILQDQSRAHRNDDDDDDNDSDYSTGKLELSGEDDDDDNEHEEVEEEDDDGHVAINLRRRRRRNRADHAIWGDDDEDENKRKLIEKMRSLPPTTHTIANFFRKQDPTSNPENDNDIDNDTGFTFKRLTQRSLIDEESQQQTNDHANNEEEKAKETEEQQNDNELHNDDLVSTPRIETDPVQDLVQTDPASEPTVSPFATMPVPKGRERNDFVEEEAEEEEDEHFGLGGPDIAETADLDRFEEDGMLVHDNNENVDNLELQAEHHKKLLEEDQHMVDRLLKDVTSGNLRRKRAAAAAGLLLDDYDLLDDMDEDDGDELIRLRLEAANRRKRMLKGNDPLHYLAKDPKTAPFVKAATVIPGELDLSGDEEDEDGDMNNRQAV